MDAIKNLDGETRGDIKVLNICAVIDHLESEGIRGYEAQSEYLQKYCKAQGVSYYAATREEFTIFGAITQAEKEGNKFVIVEDLS